MIQEDIESSPSGPEARENLMVRRSLWIKGSDEELVLSKPDVRWLKNLAR